MLQVLTKWLLPVGRLELDAVFVMPPKEAPSWILNAICREIADKFDGLAVKLVHIDEEIPPSKTYFFSHYAFYYRALRRFSPVRLGRCYIFATHFESAKSNMSDQDVASLLALSDGVICMNTALRNKLLGMGLPDRLAHVVIGAADRSIFVHHQRLAGGAVGFCAAFYPRKSPDRIIDIISSMPHRSFILLGRGWNSWHEFEKLRALPNFTYAEPDYKDYASWYARMSVFCSVATLEGGPIPLIESMFCNIVPVASRTGFAPDLIRHGDNGFLFEVNASTAEICSLIDAAFAIEKDVNEIALSCDWVPYSRSVAKIMGFDMAHEVP